MSTSTWDDCPSAPRSLIFESKPSDAVGGISEACFEWSDVVALWHSGMSVAGVEADQRESSSSWGLGRLPARTPCFSEDEVSDRVVDYMTSVMHILNRVDDRRSEGLLDLTHLAEGAAWCFGQMLRIRPFATGNFFAAQAATWMLLRLCDAPIPIGPMYPAVVRADTRRVLTMSFDYAVEQSLACEGAAEFPGVSAGASSVHQDAFLLGWLKAQLLRWRNAPGSDLGSDLGSD